MLRRPATSASCGLDIDGTWGSGSGYAPIVALKVGEKTNMIHLSSNEKLLDKTMTDVQIDVLQVLHIDDAEFITCQHRPLFSMTFLRSRDFVKN